MVIIMLYDVVTNFTRPSAELLGRFRTMQAATLHEAMDKRGALNCGIRPAWPMPNLCGCALTVQSKPGDNLMLHKAVSVAKPGDVLVVTTGGYLEAGIWGEIITVAAIAKGIRGIVTDGAVRDTVPIKTLNFPMFSRGISMKGTTKMTPGKIGVPVVIGDVLVNPGDIVVGDNDGVVVVPLAEAEAVLGAAIEKEAAEAAVMDKIRSGESTMDIMGFQKMYDMLKLNEQI